jgi:hypothetical protein
MIDSIGTQEIARQRNVAKWQEMIQYIETLTLPISVQQSDQLNNYAWEAMELYRRFHTFE